MFPTNVTGCSSGFFRFRRSGYHHCDSACDSGISISVSESITARIVQKIAPASRCQLLVLTHVLALSGIATAAAASDPGRAGSAAATQCKLNSVEVVK